MCFAITGVVLRRLMDDGFFNLDERAIKESVITNAEMRLSRLITGYGYNLKCLIPQCNQIDYRGPHSDINPTSVNGEPL